MLPNLPSPCLPGGLTSHTKIYFLFSQWATRVWLAGLSPARNWAGQWNTMQTSTNKKALERTWTSQCQDFPLWLLAAHPVASSVWWWQFSVWSSQAQGLVQHWKHQENLTVLLCKQSWHTILVLKLQYFKIKHPNPSLPMHNVGSYTQVQLQESTEMRLF